MPGLPVPHDLPEFAQASPLLPCKQVHQYHLSRFRMCVCVLVAQLCLTLCDPTGCSLPGF